MPLERALWVHFDRFLHPLGVVRQSVQVYAGLLDEEAGAPKGPSAFFSPVYNPYDRIVLFELLPGARWQPDTLHTVSIKPPSDDDDLTGIRAFDGAALSEAETFHFITASAGQPTDDERLPVVSYCHETPGMPVIPAVRDVLARSCGGAACHEPEHPALGLVLTTRQGVEVTARNVVARQTEHSATVGVPLASPLPLGANMSRIDPGHPGSSYLLYKLLINPRNYEGLAESDPLGQWRAGLPADTGAPTAEIEHLREGFVRGDAMPVGGALRPVDVRAMVAWIAQGAAVPECP